MEESTPKRIPELCTCERSGTKGNDAPLEIVLFLLYFLVALSDSEKILGTSDLGQIIAANFKCEFGTTETQRRQTAGGTDQMGSDAPMTSAVRCVFGLTRLGNSIGGSFGAFRFIMGNILDWNCCRKGVLGRTLATGNQQQAEAQGEKMRAKRR